MELHRRQRIWTLLALTLGGLWGLLAIVVLDFAVIISAAIGMIHTVGFSAAFTQLLEHRFRMIGGLVASILLTFLTAGLLLYLACRVPPLSRLNPSLCPNGYLDVGYVVLAAGWAIVGGIVFLLVGFASKRQV